MVKRTKRMKDASWLCLAAAISLVAWMPSGLGDAQTGFNTAGDILITDQFNNRIIEVNQNHDIVWQFGNGSSIPGPHSVVGPNDAQRVGDLTLISGTGLYPGAIPSCPNGCADNRVIVVNETGQIVWQYGQADVAGSGPDRLNTPVSAVFLPNKHVLITDQGNHRVIDVVQLHKGVVWQYGTTGVPGTGFSQLNSPNSAELLENGDILIADQNNNRVIEVNRQKQIVWSYNNSGDPTVLSGAAFASRVGLGNTLITDSNHSRVFEVNSVGETVFTYYTNTRPGSVSSPLPTRAIRLYNGNTLISDQINNQVIEVDPNGNIVFSQGQINLAGAGFNQLNWPYDAKMIGDYTGITPPFGNFFRLFPSNILWDNPFIL